MPWDTYEAIVQSLGYQPHQSSVLGVSRGPLPDSAGGSEEEEDSDDTTIAAMTLHLGLHHNQRSSQQQQTEAREARRLLKEQVRTDWDYPTLPQWQSSGYTSRWAEGIDEGEKRVVGGFRVHNAGAIQPGTTDLEFSPLEWRERSYSSSESEGSDIDDGESMRTSTSSKSKKSASKQANLYRFEGPDSVGVEIQDRHKAKKRKRRALLQEEIEWNEGMRHWMARRDIWCAVRTEVQIVEEGTTTAQSRADTTSVATTGTTTTTTSNPSTSSPRTSTSSNSTSASSLPSSPSSNHHSTADISTLALSNHDQQPQQQQQLLPAPLDSALLPLAPPILPNNTIRSRISPSTYPEIYNKIILQSRTPSVPINLLVLTRAMVRGWKDDGEWPPKPGVVERSIAKQRKGSGTRVKEGVKGAVGRVLRITHVGGGGGNGS